MRGHAAALVFVALTSAACAPAALTAEQIVPAFVAASQDEARTMHMEWQGTLGQPGMQPQPDPMADPSSMAVTINGSFDFNGPDYAGALQTLISGVTQGETSYARVSGAAFIDFGGSGWQRADDFGQPAFELDPLHGLSESGVAYEATDTIDGRAVHRLRVLEPVLALAGGMFANGMFGAGPPTIAEGGQNDFLIYVDSNGIPLEAHMALDLRMTVPLGIDEPDLVSSYKVRFDYKFGLWGEPVTISPPHVSGGLEGGKPIP
ncbi:MAG TPA: hypothetical protein VM284_05300 [Candidatus Limnocylindria bacterium]|nr:hypothetical protein [Candidatus Limnocylindria bacterium]